ncbi:MAG: GAF domain-containing sensor histidine kinase [Chloroflexi bacterium]|nr:GAF domain-containing sensor histidine kinase [Chloroflexota bacterium]
MQLGQRSFFIGNLVTALLVAIAVSYLGALFRNLQSQRLRTRQALDETEALFQMAQQMVQAGTDLDHLVSRTAQVVRTSGLFEQFAVFLHRQGSLQLAASSVGVEELRADLVDKAAKEQRTLIAPNTAGSGWYAAVPMLVGEELLGVVTAGVRGGRPRPGQSVHLVEAIANQLAVGIHNVSLARQKAELAAQEERGRIAREIHDGIAQSIYMLSLQLETCAELAQQQRHDLRERLGKLVALSKETLLEVRHYIYDLKPYLAGEKGAAAMVEHQVREFDKVAGILAHLETVGEERQVPVPVATCLYRVTQEALANVFKHAGASRVELLLEFLPGEVQLAVKDNGQGFDATKAPSGHGLQNMRQRAEELGGSFTMRSAPGKGTEVVIRLPC